MLGKQREIYDNESILFRSKVAKLASVKELGDSSIAKYILCLLNKVKIMGTKLNTSLNINNIKLYIKYKTVSIQTGFRIGIR
jgi:hypothetical protein